MRARSTRSSSASRSSAAAGPRCLSRTASPACAWPTASWCWAAAASRPSAAMRNCWPRAAVTPNCSNCRRPATAERGGSFVFDGDDDVAGRADGQLHLDFLVDAPAQQGPGQGRIHADQAGPGIGFVGADDAVAQQLAADGMLKLDPGAEIHDVRIGRPALGDLQHLQALAQVADPAVDLAQLLLAVGVFGVLA